MFTLMTCNDYEIRLLVIKLDELFAHNLTYGIVRSSVALYTLGTYMKC